LWACIEHRDPNGEVQTKGKGKVEPDSELRDTENVPLSDDIKAYFASEVKPHAADAWIDESKSKVGYEVPFNRHFYVFKTPRDLAVIDNDLKAVTANILKMLGGLSRHRFAPLGCASDAKGDCEKSENPCGAWFFLQFPCLGD